MMPSPELSVERLNEATQDFDDLWDSTKSQYIVTNVRSSEIINWLCFGKEDGNKRLFACYRSGELVGYSVCMENTDIPVSRLEVIDLWTKSEDLDVGRALRSEAVKYGIEKRYGLVEFPRSNPFIHRVCDEMGMLSRTHTSRTEYMRASKSISNTMLHSRPYFVKAQGDYGA